MNDGPAASSDLLDAALDIARTAGDMTLKWFQSSNLAIEVKGDGTPVTEADKTAEHYIRERIIELAPNSNIVGEEEGTSEGTSEPHLVHRPDRWHQRLHPWRAVVRNVVGRR